MSGECPVGVWKLFNGLESIKLVAGNYRASVYMTNNSVLVVVSKYFIV